MNLTQAQQERLYLLVEEAAEVQHIVSKILRHGYESYNPFDKEKKKNIFLLEKELGDLMFAIHFLASERDIDLNNVDVHKQEKRNTIQRYLHFNKLSIESK